MYSSDESDTQEAERSHPGDPVPRFCMRESSIPYAGGLTSAPSDVAGLLKSFADTQQFHLTGPLLTPMSLVSPINLPNNFHQLLSRITGSADLSCLVHSQMGDVTVWSMPVDNLHGVYCGVLYAAPTTCLSSLMTISLHRFVDGESVSPEPDSSTPFPSEASGHVSLSTRFPISYTFIRAFSLVAQQVNRSHSNGSHAPSSQHHIDLTHRQKEVLSHSSQGLTAPEVARLLGCSESTVNNHLRSALSLLSCGSKALAVLKAARLGLIPCPH